ncbi:MAG TPA: alpha-amylase family glycosyl hydrolase [Chryseolinea sp.]|nr:alpha-amylase family glycosyl hydrolase [Chryseolinea sp.]
MLRALFCTITLLVFFSCREDSLTEAETEEELTYPPPEIWWNDQVFYEVFVRSFYDSNGDGIGDFNGLTQKLDYLNDGDPSTETDLGVTALWLMPIHPSPSYHGYDVTDYRDVNPYYGTMTEFKHFLDEAHKRGIKVIIDFVINHTSDQHPWFVNSSSGTNAEKRSWYIWNSSNPGDNGPWGQTVWHQRNNAYFFGLFNGGMPDLNHRNKNVYSEIQDIVRFWHDDIGVDGFRVDVAGGLIEEGQAQVNTQSTLDWWRKFYSFQKNMDPAFMTVGEVWSSTSVVSPFSDQRLDYCFEFDLSYAIVGAVRSGNSDGLIAKMEEVLGAYNELQYGTFLTNHDQNRVIEEFELNVDKAKLAAGILLSLPGVPYMYYGEEVAMRGVKPDESIRRPMQWTSGAQAGFTTGSPWLPPQPNYTEFNVADLQQEPTSVWNHYRKLIKCRLNNLALKQGNYERVGSNSSVIYTFLRIKDNDAVLAIHNISGNLMTDIHFSIAESGLVPGTYNVTDMLNETDLGTLTVGPLGSLTNFKPLAAIPALSSHLLKLEKQ